METSFHAAINTGKINGAVVCATNADGTFTYNKAFGSRTLLSGEKQPQKLDDILFLASATKLVTTIAALQCVEDGLLTLDGDLSAIAPELASKQIITGFSDEDGSPQLDAPIRPITLKMLLTHSAGTCYHFMNPLVGKWREQNASTGTGLRPVEELFNYPLSFQPGDGWMYGSGLDWAGRVIERVTHGTLIEFMQKRIFDPLGISDGQFFPVTRSELRDRLVDLNPNDPDGLGLAVVGGSGDMNTRTKGDFGGHGLFLPGTDYVKILHSLLVSDGKLLKLDTVDNMFEHHLGPEATASQQAALDSPLGVFFRVGTEPGTKVGHGLGGLLMLEDVDGWYGERTLTWGGGLTLAWFIDRKNGLCGVGAIQAALPVDGKLVSELKQVFRHNIYYKYNAWKKEQNPN
ncbi:Beta-lactamase-like protein [Penicillium soppii]|uniref:Beta-lactamase-like protein n=1 Tax=Penicillium soppii TaxID=69789 RepID=UPI00254827F2|nr:Beta-lactamase-like protein [Penicillium soppii]KAJ5881678.1 Beta-lactamase-like protein [Penicillium soppii]